MYDHEIASWSDINQIHQVINWELCIKSIIILNTTEKKNGEISKYFNFYQILQATNQGLCIKTIIILRYSIKSPSKLVNMHKTLLLNVQYDYEITLRCDF